jgi:hypothetical protein
MGGMSFQCPLCPSDAPYWTTNPRALRDHLRDKHGIKGAEITGTGPATVVSMKPQKANRSAKHVDKSGNF